MILIFNFLIFSDYGRYYYPNYASDTNRPKRQKNATDYFYDYDLTSSDSTDSDDPLFISYNVTFSEETEDLPFKSQDYSSFISEVDTETSANNYPSNIRLPQPGFRFSTSTTSSVNVNTVSTENIY